MGINRNTVDVHPFIQLFAKGQPRLTPKMSECQCYCDFTVFLDVYMFKIYSFLLTYHPCYMVEMKHKQLKPVETSFPLCQSQWQLHIIEFLLSCRYAANIEKIDYEDEKVLIHYRQWSHRYDEWFDWTSPYLRPVERIQLRRQGLQDDAPVPVS